MKLYQFVSVVETTANTMQDAVAYVNSYIANYPAEKVQFGSLKRTKTGLDVTVRITNMGIQRASLIHVEIVDPCEDKEVSDDGTSS